MDGKVRVALRCRPLVSMEVNEGCQMCVKFRPEINQIIMSDSRQFTFDCVFPPEVNQDEVYQRCARTLVDSIFEGFNATVVAYGQTGSGKTFTMGTSDVDDYENAGVIPKAVSDLFKKVSEIKGTHQCTIQTSFLEIYNEELHDLLDEPSRTLNVREHPDGGIQIVGLTEFPTDEEKLVFECLRRGAEHRTVATTAMNERSSRSHAILTIHVNVQNVCEAADKCSAKFHLVDLAGSERVKKTQAEGNRFKEGVNINRGLLALGNVISALCERESNYAKRTHIPYRDSKLTRILQDSLGGNSQTIMIACISPADKNFEETLNTLRYADRARQIKNKPTVNRDPQMMEILQLKEMVRQLQAHVDPHIAASILNTPQPSTTSVVNTAQPVQKQGDSLDRDKYIRLQQENRLLTDDLDQAIDRTTALYRQVLQMELLQEQLNPRFEGLKNSLSSLIEEYRSENRPPDVEDLEQQLKSITELHKSLIDSDQVIPAEEPEQKENAIPTQQAPVVKMEETSDNVGNVDEGNVDIKEEAGDQGDNEEKAAEAAKVRGQRVALQRELSALDVALRQKERLLASMQDNNEEFTKKISGYEVEISELNERIKKMESEQEQMRRQLTDNTENDENSTSNTTAISQTNNGTRTRLRELEAKLQTMRSQVMELKRVKREREQRETECGRLKEEINKLKATKVRMVRQMAEDSAANKRWRAAKEKEVRKLQDKDRRMQNELLKMNAAHQRRTAVLQRKMEAAAAAERRLKETLLRQRESVNQRIRRVEENDKSSVNIRVKNWLTGEIEKSVSITEAKAQLESLLEDRKGIAEQLAHARRAGRQNDVEELEMELRRRNQQIGNLQNMISDAESDDQAEKARWNYLHSLVEARCGLKFLYKEIIKARSNLREKMSECEEVNCQLRQQEEENNTVQARLECQLNNHETGKRQLMKQLEQYSHENDLLKKRLEDIESLFSNKEDKGTTPPTPFLPQRKRRKVSEYEEPEEEEDVESSFMESALIDDPNDSDWHLTPAAPRRRVKRSDSKRRQTEVTENETRTSDATSVTNISPSKDPESTSSQLSQVSSEPEEKKMPPRTSQSMKCRCRTKCQGRCGCMKSNMPCNDNCRCSADTCGNRRQEDNMDDEVSAQASEVTDDDFDIPEVPTSGELKADRRKRFGGSMAENVMEDEGEDLKMPVVKRKLLDPRTTIFESPLLHL